MASSRTATSRYAGLDGLRAIAVALVVVYHLFRPVLPGGYIGVDVFFVISGFLITTLLLRAHVRRETSVLGFWRRRARRLVPALAAMVTVCASLALMVGGDVLYRMGAQVVGAATFSYNWWAVAGGGDYFSANAPELFRNLWSLAVEEQFYLVWPLVLPLFFVLRRTWMLVLAAIAVAGASTLHMFLLLHVGGGLTRVYYGTDTHAIGLLLGAAIAFALAPLLSRAHTEPAVQPASDGIRYVTVPPRPTAPSLSGDAPYIVLPAGWTLVLPPSRREAPRRSESTPVRVVLTLIGLGALVALAALAVSAPVDEIGYAWSVVLASLLTAIVVTAAVWPGSPLGRVLDAAPLRWIGDRSYGIYLWHWPLLVLALAWFGMPGTETAAPLWVGVGVLIVTVIAAAVSYRWLEQPVRRYGLFGAMRRVVAHLRAAGPQRLRALTAVGMVVAVLFGTGAAIAAAPPRTSAQQVVAAGQEILDRAAASPAAPSESATPHPGSAATTAPPASAAGPRTITGDSIDAIGDSVMLASAGGLLERFPGIRIDAEVSRSMWAGPRLIQALADRGTLREYVVVALGTNGAVDAGSLERMVDVIGPERTLVLVTAAAPRDWIPAVNRDLMAFAAAHPRVIIADWAAAISGHANELAGDGIHPGAAGGRRFADTVAIAIARAEQQRFDAEQERREQVRQRIREHFEYLRSHDLPAPQ